MHLCDRGGVRNGSLLGDWGDKSQFLAVPLARFHGPSWTGCLWTNEWLVACHFLGSGVCTDFDRCLKSPSEKRGRQSLNVWHALSIDDYIPSSSRVWHPGKQRNKPKRNDGLDQSGVRGSGRTRCLESMPNLIFLGFRVRCSSPRVISIETASCLLDPVLACKRKRRRK